MKRFHPYWVPPLLMLLFASLSCQVLAKNDPTELTRVRFRDDFSETSSGWNRISTTQGETEYSDGVYRIFVNEPNLDIWSLAGLDLSDVRIEVDALKVGGERDNRFGVICRAVNPESFYTFIVSSDGYYGIGKIRGQDYTLIGMDALQPTEAINKGSAINRLRADCIGDTLTLYVNGVRLAEVRDSDFASGDIGLIAGTYQTPGTDIRFDNLVVYQP